MPAPDATPLKDGDRICASASLRDAGPGVRFCLLRHGMVTPAFAVRHQGIAHAYENRCAHRSLELDWIPGQFFDPEGRFLICATHGALYDPARGSCAGGPCAGQGLVAIPVVERDGEVLIHL